MDVSVVIPCRNGASTLGAQLSSLLAQQTSCDFEVIVADNGSTDGTADLVQEFYRRDPRFRLVDASQRVGANAARNIGVRAARAQLILMCDADDIVQPGWIDALWHALSSGAQCVGGGVDHILPDGRRGHGERALYRSGDYPDPYALTANCGFVREAFTAIGGFDEQFSVGADDIDFFWRAAAAGYRLTLVPDAVIDKRMRTTLSAVFWQRCSYGRGRVRHDRVLGRPPAPVLRAARTVALAGWRAARDLCVRDRDSWRSFVERIGWEVGVFVESVGSGRLDTHGGCGPVEPSSNSAGFGPAWLLSDDPPVFLTGITYDENLGIAEAFGIRYGDTAAGFIVFPTWSLEARKGRAEEIAGRLAAHAARYPRHRFRYITNTAAEAELLRGAGVPATFLNKNVTVSEHIFQPLPDVPVEFDAVYNARFVPEKRHELAATIPRVGYITYADDVSVGQEEVLCNSDIALRRNHNHVLLNERRRGSIATMSKEEVNAALARASVGLVLSEVEGSSYASMEYLLAGLPVVSTRSIGGRDVYFDPEHCIVCEPDPGAIRDAVATLQARNFPRELVRARVLARIEPERRRLLALADELISELGGARRYTDGEWPFPDISGITWRTYEQHFAALAADRQRSTLCRELGFADGALAGTQLEVQELRPVIEAVRQRPGCRLLLFGCGNDSSFWEAVNRGGTTAFLEDNPRWAETVRAKLSTATIHVVSYDTRVADGLALLDRSDRLAMELPPQVAHRRWDVILVDGPAGYSADKPGRMKAIYAASHLVAPGGYVFVHDCERPIEKAYAEKYLGDDRLVVEATGRAVLRGYRFEAVEVSPS